MTPDTITDLARSLVPPDWYPTFSQEALRWAAESQKATAIPALVFVASSSLLVALWWAATVTLVARLVWRAVRG